MQHAVVAEAYYQFLGLRLEVDVRGRVVGSLGDDAVHQLDDRRFVDLLADVSDFVGRDLPAQRLLVDVSGHIVVQAGQLGDLREDVFLGGDGRLDIEPGEDAQVVYGEDVGRIHHCHDDGVLVRECYGKRGVATGILLRDETHGRCVAARLCQIQEAHAKATTQGLSQLDALDPAFSHQDLADAQMALFLFLQSLLELLRCDEPHLDEYLADAFLAGSALRDIFVRQLHQALFTSCLINSTGAGIPVQSSNETVAC